MEYITHEKAIHIISKHDLHRIELAELMVIEEVLTELHQTNPTSDNVVLIAEFLAYMQLRRSESWVWMFFCLQQQMLHEGKHLIGKTGLKYTPPTLDHYEQNPLSP